MPVRTVATQVLEHEPLFVSISGQPQWFIRQCFAGGINWEHLSFAELAEGEASALLRDAHRIVFDSAGCPVPSREQIITSLLPFQNKLKIIIPIYSYLPLRVAGEIPGWQILFVWQQAQVLHWSTLLPDADLIFLRDITDWEELSPFFSLLTQALSDDVVYLPTSVCAPLGKTEVARVLSEEMGAPARGSVLIQATEFSLERLFEDAIPVYEVMHRARIRRQKVGTSPQPLLPFPCLVREISSKPAQSVNRTIALIPTPSQRVAHQDRLRQLLSRCQEDPWFIQRAGEDRARREREQIGRAQIEREQLEQQRQQQAQQEEQEQRQAEVRQSLLEQERQQAQHVQQSQPSQQNQQTQQIQPTQQTQDELVARERINLVGANPPTNPPANSPANPPTNPPHLEQTRQATVTPPTTKLFPTIHSGLPSPSAADQPQRALRPNPLADNVSHVPEFFVSNEPPLATTPSPIVTRETPLITLSEGEKEDQLKQDVRRLFGNQNFTQHAARLVQRSKQRKTVRRRSRKRAAVFYLGLGFVSLGLLLAALLGSLQITQQLLRRELYSVSTTIAQSKTMEPDSINWGNVPFLLSVLAPQQKVLSTIFSLPLLDVGDALTSAQAQLRNALKLRQQNANNLQKLYQIITAQSDGKFTEVSARVASDAQAMKQLTDELQTTVAQLPDPLQTSLASAAATILPSQTDKKTELASKIVIPKLGNLFGLSGRRQYAVVLQNSQELRATGGFIEAVAILTFENGVLITRDIRSSYQLDSLLTGQVKPPVDLAAALGENQWWVHDANWSADGAQAAKQVAWFVEKTLQQQVDGVIVINTSSLPQLLRTLGPVEMKEFNEVLTEKNIEERLEYHNEVPSQIPAGKPEYRKELLSQLLNKLTTLPTNQVAALLTLAQQLADDKHVFYFFADSETQQGFRQLGWTNDLAFPVCPKEYAVAGCVTDGLAIVESNIGVNRANAYIKREQEHLTVLTASNVHNERKIHYSNTATSKAWPKGDYRAYLRLYLPGKPNNIVVTYDNVVLKPTEVSVRANEVGSEIAFTITVPIATTKELVVSYDQSLQLSPTSTYVFYENRQAGITDATPPLLLTYPNAWQVGAKAPTAVNLGNQLSFPAATTPYLMRVVQFAPAH